MTISFFSFHEVQCSKNRLVKFNVRNDNWQNVIKCCQNVLFGLKQALSNKGVLVFKDMVLEKPLIFLLEKLYELWPLPMVITVGCVCGQGSSIEQSSRGYLQWASISVTKFGSLRVVLPSRLMRSESLALFITNLLIIVLLQ